MRPRQSRGSAFQDESSLSPKRSLPPSRRQPMTADERALCTVMAALLRRGRLVHGLCLPLTLVTFVAVALLGVSPDMGAGAGVKVLAVAAAAGLCETVFAARVAFD